VRSCPGLPTTASGGVGCPGRSPARARCGPGGLGSVPQVGKHALHVGMGVGDGVGGVLDLGLFGRRVGDRVHRLHLDSRVRIGGRGVQHVGHAREAVGLIAGQSHGGRAMQGRAGHAQLIQPGGLDRTEALGHEQRFEQSRSSSRWCSTQRSSAFRPAVPRRRSSRRACLRTRSCRWVSRSSRAGILAPSIPATWRPRAGKC
jgi:hypothetical protein